MLAVFDDDATIRHALAFELALARAEAVEGIIEDAAAAAIATACAAVAIVPADLANEAALAGTLAIPLVKRLRAAVPGAAAAAVHKGALLPPADIRAADAIKAADQPTAGSRPLAR